MTPASTWWWPLAGALALLAYCHVGYPLLLGGLTLLARKREAPSSPDTPSVTLIIAAFNEQDVIAAKVENALALDYPPGLLRVIVAADGSTDDTATVARRFESRGVTVLHAPERRGKAAAMTRAAEMARSDILLFSDANAFYKPDAVRSIVRRFADPAVGLASGRKVVMRAGQALESSERLYWSYESFIRSRETALGSTTGVVGEILAVRRTLFRPIPSHIIQDDAYLALSVLEQGSRVVYEPGAISVESGALSVHDEFTRRVRISAGRWQLAAAPRLWPWKQPLTLFALWSHKYLRLVAPLLLGVVLLCSVLLAAGQQPLGQALLWAQLVAYGVAAAGLASETARRLRLARLLAYFLAGHVATACGLLTFLAGRQSPTWKPVRHQAPVRTEWT